ncbi:unnamed protein product [Rangifer tarandus platyrhynchus]|uniref:Uncharacterized protein n=2 Tax=Rangifer tarandus platyrhynchus TaxID=3082113 RepID=A0ABN8YSR7_RANTA|nr:unnamed protein product [Rangifer tarandus platyrhynchus]
MPRVGPISQAPGPSDNILPVGDGVWEPLLTHSDGEWGLGGPSPSWWSKAEPLFDSSAPRGPALAGAQGARPNYRDTEGKQGILSLGWRIFLSYTLFSFLKISSGT